MSWQASQCKKLFCVAGQGVDPDTFSHIPSLAAFLAHLPGERVMYTTTIKDFLYGAIT